MAGWKSEEEAKKGIWEMNGKNECEKVIIVTKAKCASAVVCRLFSQRFNSKLTSFEKKEDIWYLTVE